MSFNLTKQQRIAILNEVTILTGVKPTTNSLKNDVGFFIFLIRVFSNNDNIIINEPAVPNTDGIGTTGNGSAVDLGGNVGTVSEPNNPEIGLPRSNSITFTDGASDVLFKIEQNISGQGIISSVAFSINLTPTNFKVSPPSSNTDFNVDGNSIDQTADRLTFTVPDSGEGSVSLRMLSDSSSARFEYVVPPSEFTGNIVPTSEHVNSTLGQKSVSNALRAVDGDDINKVIFWTGTEWDVKDSDGGVAGNNGEIQFNDNGSPGALSEILVQQASALTINVGAELTNAFKAKVVGTKLYVLEQNGNLEVYDLTTGNHISAESFTTGQTPRDFAVDATTLYVLVSTSLIVTYNLGTGTQQNVWGVSQLLSANAQGITIDSAKLYVTTLSPAKVFVFNATNGTNISGEEFGAGTLSSPSGITINSGKAYVVSGSVGNNIVNVFNVSTGANIPGEEFGSGDFGAVATAIDIDSGKAYVADQSNGIIRVYNVATELALTGENQVLASVFGVVVDNEILFAVNNTGNINTYALGSSSFKLGLRFILNNAETYANNAEASSAGLPLNTIYKTSTGKLRIVV